MDVRSLPYKIGELIDGEWRAHRYDDRFAREPLEKAAGERLVIAAARPFDTFYTIVSGFSPPVGILIVLHTPRADGQEGRYESPDLDIDQALSFLGRYKAAFERDARADVWVRCHETEEVAVYEKHDYVFCYGDLDKHEALVRSAGFRQGLDELPFPHTHHYREEFDVDFAAMLQEFPWQKTELHPEDGD